MAGDTQKVARSREATVTVYWAYVSANPEKLLPGHAAQLAGLTGQWISTSDPSYMDAALSFCHQNCLPVLPELSVYMNAAMQKRISDGSSRQKAFKDAAKTKLLEEMAKLIYHGATIIRASEIAAFISHADYPFQFKASTLEKAYSGDRDRLDTFAKEVFELSGSTDAQRESTAEMWQRYVRMPFDITPEMKGETR